MLQDLYIVHRAKPAVFEDLGYPVWSTCLRSLAFVKPHRFTPVTGDEVYSRGEAYRFILEVICGLRSPISAETEVFGQFKTFSREWVQLEPLRLALVQKLLADAKAVRAAHLSGLGSQSYGGWLRKNLTSSRVHIFGGGQLAGEILPYLRKHCESIVFHVRRPEKSNLDLPIYALNNFAFDRGALIVAAPVIASDVRGWLSGRVPEQIFDLRETSSVDPIAPKARVLAEIFAEIERTRIHLRPRLEAARRDIAERSQKAADQAQLRPQGWDDICA